jgi:hypothetical protein
LDQEQENFNTNQPNSNGYQKMLGISLQFKLQQLEDAVTKTRERQAKTSECDQREQVLRYFHICRKILLRMGTKAGKNR